MKFINIKRFALKAFTIGVLSTIIVTGSMVTLASSNRPVGELLVNGNQVVENGVVTVNGEAAKSGRTIFSSSTITTPETSSATLNLGKAGKLQLAPGTTFVVNVAGNTVSGDLRTGSVTVLNALQSVGVSTLGGETVILNSGETASATSTSASKAAKPGPGGLDWAIWAAIIGGAAAAIIIAVVVSDDDVVSPVR